MNGSGRKHTITLKKLYRQGLNQLWVKSTQKKIRNQMNLAHREHAIRALRTIDQKIT